MKKRIVSMIIAILVMISMINVSGVHEKKAYAAVKLTSEQIKNHCNNLVGTNYPSGLCLAFVADVFKALGAGTSSACCAYNYGSNYIISSSSDNIPVGADVFFSGSNITCSNCGNRCGHIAIYVGDGYVVHSYNGTVHKDKLSTVMNWSNYTYRGWGYHGNVIIDDNKDTTPPVISNIQITNLSSNGYTITCTVTDDVALNYVKIHTWTEKNGQDDMKIEEIVSDGGTISYRVNISDHNNEAGNYVTHIYAYDKAGNLTPDSMGRTVITIPDNDTTPPVISNIRITNLSSNGYTVTCTVTDDVALDYVKIHTWTEKNGQDDMKIEEIVSDGGTISYRVNTSDHNNEAGNYVTHIYAYDKAGNLTPDSMGRTIITIPNDSEPVDISLELSELKLEIGEEQILKAVITPQDATNQQIYWSSSNTSIAVVDENGKVTAKSQGSAVILATIADGNKLATCIVTVNPPKVNSGWKKDSKGWWYQNTDGTYPKNTWKKISGKWYHFDANGYMQTGWYLEGTIYYYLKSDGSMAADEWVDNGKYYVDAGGKWIKNKVKVTEGWKKDSKGWWYQNADGTYPKNTWKRISGKWYHFNTNGYMQTGWYKDGTTYYYLKSDGSMAVNEWVDNGKYYVDSQGRWVQNKTK